MHNQYNRKLKSIYLLKHQQDTLQQVSINQLQSQKLPVRLSTKQIPKSFKNLIRKLKAQALVKEFIKRLRVNLTSSKPVTYDQIQQLETNKRTDQKKTKGIHLSEIVRVFVLLFHFMATLCILMISTFQGFFEGFRQTASHYDLTFGIKGVCLGMFVIKILLSLVSVRVSQGKIYDMVQDIAYRYAGSWTFIGDICLLLSAAALLAFPSNIEAGIIGFIVVLLNTPTMLHILELIESAVINTYRKKQYWNLGKIIVFNIFFTHTISILLFLMSLMNSSHNWLTSNNIHGQFWYTQYIWGYYWAITIITTVGFGDITVANYQQGIFLSIVILFGTLILAYNISEVGNIISNLRNLDLERNNDCAVFRRMAKDNHISDALQEKILFFINKQAAVKSQMEFFERKQVLEKLPPKLRQKFRVESSLRILIDLPFFNLLQKETHAALAERISQHLYMGGDFLVKKETGFSEIMILEEGEIGYIYCRKGSYMNGEVIEKRTIFKEDNPYLLNKYLILPGKSISYSIRAQGYCFLHQISLKNFREALLETPQDHQLFFRSYDKAALVQIEWQRQKCRYCVDRKHSVFNCPRLHYIPFKAIIIAKYLQSQKKQPRVSSETYNFRVRRQPLRNNALLHWESIFKQYEEMWEIRHKKNLKKRNVDYEYLENLMENREEIDIDQMHDFEVYFPRCNPERLNYVDLNRNKVKTHRYVDRLFSSNRIA